MPRQPYEDPQLSQLAAIAQIAHLMTQPQQNQQELDQKDQATRVTAALHLMGMMQEHAHNQAALDELTRYHSGELQHGQAALDAATKERETIAKSNVTDALISHTLNDPTIPSEVKAETLKNLGYPQFSDALQTQHGSELQRKIAGHIATIGALQESKRQAAISDPAIQSDPEVAKAVKDAFPTTPTTTSTSETSSTPGYSPELASTIGQAVKYLPITTANLGALLYNKTLVPPLNLLNSAVGAGPLYPTKMAPQDYNVLFRSLLKPEAQRQ